MTRRAAALAGVLIALLVIGVHAGAGRAGDRAVRARSGPSEPAPARTRAGGATLRPAAAPVGPGITGSGGSSGGSATPSGTSSGGSGGATPVGPSSLSGPPPPGQPRLSGFTPSCVRSGETLTVTGSRLGSAARYGLLMGGAGPPRTLSTSSWSTTQIVASVPAVEPGRIYLVNLTGRAGVAGNRLTVPACAAPPTPTSTPAGVQPAPNPPTTRDATPTVPEPRLETGLEPGLVMVAVDDDAAAQALPARVARVLGLARVSVDRQQPLPALGLILVALRLPADLSPKAAAGRLQAAGLIADPNDHYAPAASDAERDYPRQLIGLGAPDAGCGAGLRVGLVDTGVDVDHPVLAGRAVRTRAFHGAGRPASTEHGTAVAALLVGTGDVSGLLPASTLHVAAAFRAAGSDPQSDVEAIARGLDWLVSEGVSAVNLSLAGPPNRVLGRVLERGLSRRVAIAAAAGNEGPGAPPAFPAAHPGVVAVTAVDAGLRAYRRANRGDYVDLAAPGVDVWTAAGRGGGKFATGTSYAAPFVTAALALAAAAEPDAPAERLLQRLVAASRDLGERGNDGVFGHGLVQLPHRCGAGDGPG